MHHLLIAGKSHVENNSLNGGMGVQEIHAPRETVDEAVALLESRLLGCDSREPIPLNHKKDQSLP